MKQISKSDMGKKTLLRGPELSGLYVSNIVLLIKIRNGIQEHLVFVLSVGRLSIRDINFIFEMYTLLKEPFPITRISNLDCYLSSKA